MEGGALLSPRTVLLNDGVTEATIYPVWDGSQVPLELVASLWVEYNAEVDRGRSFPETHKLMLDTFERSWFVGVAGVIVRGSAATSLEDLDFLGSTQCFGSFFIEPCYPGRSSHICTAKFLVHSRMRRLGVGTRLAACFMDWAPRLGYDYAMFDLVYATNTAFCKILQRLGFQLLARLRGAGILNGCDYPVDALKFGREVLVDDDEAGPRDPFAALSAPPMSGLGGPSMSGMAMNEVPVGGAPVGGASTGVASVSGASVSGAIESEKPLQSQPQSQLGSFQPEPDMAEGAIGDPDGSTQYAAIKMYLETGVYPEHASRVEKTRLRSRSRSYYVKSHVLYFKRTNAVIVADPRDQMRTAMEVHRENHNGINAMQKKLAEKYHWSNMRDTITRVIHQCPECRTASRLSTFGSPSSGALHPRAVPQPAMSPQPPAPSGTLDLGPEVGPEEGPPMLDSGLQPPRDPYESGKFRWESVVYLPPEEDDGEYVPETEPYSDRAAYTSTSAPQEWMADQLLDDDEDTDWQGQDLGLEDEDDDEEYMDDGNDDDDDEEDEDDRGDPNTGDADGSSNS